MSLAFGSPPPLFFLSFFFYIGVCPFIEIFIFILLPCTVTAAAASVPIHTAPQPASASPPPASFFLVLIVLIRPVLVVPGLNPFHDLSDPPSNSRPRFRPRPPILVTYLIGAPFLSLCLQSVLFRIQFNKTLFLWGEGGCCLLRDTCCCARDYTILSLSHSYHRFQHHLTYVYP